MRCISLSRSKCLAVLFSLQIFFGGVDGQLHLPNASFEDFGDHNLHIIPQWDNCSGSWFTNSSQGVYDSMAYGYSTPDLYNDTSIIITKAADGVQFVGFVSLYSRALAMKGIGEKISAEVKCGQMLADYKYNFFLYLNKRFEQSVDGCFIVYLSGISCDTSNLIYEARIGTTDWYKTTIEYIPTSNASYLTMGVDFCLADSLSAVGNLSDYIYYSYIAMDGLSPIVSDTAYNSEHKPIVLVREPCIGDTMILRSPVDYEASEIVWLRSGIEVGRGMEYRDTISVPTEYYMLLGEDSCQSLVLRRTIVPSGCAQDGLLQFPNAFSPNGDGKNDFFGPAYISPQLSSDGYELMVYDRYGQEVYRSIFPYAQGWSAEDYAIGSYIYTVRFEDIYGHGYAQHGTVTLLR